MIRSLAVFFSIAVLACSPRANKINSNSTAETNTGSSTVSIAPGASLKVLSYNIHHCNPPSAGSLINVDTIAGVIRKYDPDLVALQEVDVNTKRSGSVDQAKLLGEKTGLKPYFFKAINHDGGEYGIAILSKFPVSEFKQYPLPTIAETKGEPRVLGTITLKDNNGKELLFACTHLDAQKDNKNRLLQIEEIKSVLKNVSMPVIIAGDLNAATGSEVINRFDQHFTRTCKECAFTIPVLKPNKTIDFVGYAPATTIAVSKHEVINENYASDHLPVYVELVIR